MVFLRGTNCIDYNAAKPAKILALFTILKKFLGSYLGMIDIMLISDSSNILARLNLYGGRNYVLVILFI